MVRADQNVPCSKNAADGALAGVSILVVLFRQLGPAFADEHDRRGFGNHSDIANLQLGQVDTVEHVGKFADESDALH